MQFKATPWSIVFNTFGCVNNCWIFCLRTAAFQAYHPTSDRVLKKIFFSHNVSFHENWKIFDKNTVHFPTADIKVSLQTLILFELGKMRTKCEKCTMLTNVGLCKTDLEVGKRLVVFRQRYFSSSYSTGIYIRCLGHFWAEIINFEP